MKVDTTRRFRFEFSFMSLADNPTETQIEEGFLTFFGYAAFNRENLTISSTDVLSIKVSVKHQPSSQSFEITVIYEVPYQNLSFSYDNPAKTSVDFDPQIFKDLTTASLIQT